MVKLIALVFLVSIFKTSLGNFECYDMQSVVSHTDGGKSITLACPAPSHIVACGFKTQYSAETNVDGAYLNDWSYSMPRCVARNAFGGNGVYATARCCTLPQNAIITTAQNESTYFSNQDDAIASLGCANFVSSEALPNTYLLGCSAYSTENVIDGGFYRTKNPAENELDGNANVDMDSTNICSAVASSNNGGKVYPQGICCTSPTVGMTCKRRFSSAAIGAGAIASTTCSNGYILMGCVGWGNHANVNAWYTEGNSCKTRG
eukprot:553060_1